MAVLMKPSVIDEAKTFDKEGIIKSKVDAALEKLQVFKEKYPFQQNPDSIDNFSEKDVFNRDGSTGDFFLYIQYHLDNLGHLILYTNEVYYNIQRQLGTFRELLYIVVDPEKTLAEKVDAPWKEIKGLGGDSHIAKKIIFCFNYETGLILPIFSTAHLEYFVNTILEKPQFPFNYDTLSLGEKYEFLTDELFKAKDSHPTTKKWEITYFCWFLYQTYPPPQKTTTTLTQEKHKRDTAVLEQQQEFGKFMNLLTELKRKEKISAEDWRTYRDQWQKNPDGRKTLTDRLLSLN
jgi:hypothetical protein